MPIITVSREYGCGGEYVAERIAKKLGYKYISNELVQYIAILTGTPSGTVESYDEEQHSSMKASISKFMDVGIFKDMFTKSAKTEEDIIDYIDEKRTLFTDVTSSNYSGFDSDAFLKMTQRVMGFLVNEDNCVILGRGGQCLLQKEANVFHIRIVASKDMRIQWVVNREKVSEKIAESKISEIDKRKESFIRHYHNADIGDPALYHLVVNLEKLTLERATDVITSAVKAAF